MCAPRLPAVAGRSHVTNLRRGSGVIPADKHLARKGSIMFSTNLTRSVATLGVVAGLLAAAGPASAQILEGPVLGQGWAAAQAGG